MKWVFKTQLTFTPTLILPGPCHKASTWEFPRGFLLPGRLTHFTLACDPELCRWSRTFLLLWNTKVCLRWNLSLAVNTQSSKQVQTHMQSHAVCPPKNVYTLMALSRLYKTSMLWTMEENHFQISVFGLMKRLLNLTERDVSVVRYAFFDATVSDTAYLTKLVDNIIPWPAWRRVIIPPL
jgi:hypothetical protein